MKARTKKMKAPLEIWKFGGASVVDAAAMRNVVALIKGHSGPLVVVVSALGGVTETCPGQFQFTDPQAANFGKRFYRVRSR